ncbi:MAG: acetylglutamate kinase [Candidatus Aerophobetes bacterium]
MEEALKRAKVLVEALPYIQKFSGKTVVAKLGGKAMGEKLSRDVAQDIVLMRYVGIKPVVIHGGGEAISSLMKRLGIKPRFIEGNRVTDQETMDVVEMVLVGKINKRIVSMLNQCGGRAVGLEGRDGQLIVAKKRQDKPLGLVGEVEEVNSSYVQILQKEGFIPVIAPVGADRKGVALNINADIMAAEVASALKAEKLIFLTDVEGILEDPSSGKTPISTITLKQIGDMLAKGMIEKGMMPKVEGCQKALEGGVNKVHIISGKLSHSLLLEIFTDEGIGTEIIR